MNAISARTALAPVFLLLAGPALACGESPCPPPIKTICHNIGGPQDLGANCDGTGNCSFTTVDSSQTITVPEDHFLGIIIPPKTSAALAAHLAHGDGLVVATFDPPLHLASTIGPHRASNVECMGERVFPQPPEPGN